MYELHEWERHPDFPESDIRRDEGESIVASLAPEGLGESQCWAWTIHTATRLPQKYGVNFGSAVDKEVARRQADEALTAYGYTFKDPASWAAAARRNASDIAQRVLGMRFADAASLAQSAGITFRTGPARYDDEGLRRDRVTVTLTDGIVTEARIG